MKGLCNSNNLLFRNSYVETDCNRTMAHSRIVKIICNKRQSQTTNIKSKTFSLLARMLNPVVPIVIKVPYPSHR